MFYIYMIHNILNNKIYVGKSENPYKRWIKHIRIAHCERNKEKFYIHRAIAKYGDENFNFSIIQELASEPEAALAETYWIGFFNSRNNKFGYNQTNGGEGVSGRIVSEITRQKMREKATGRKHTGATKELLKRINLGKMPSNLEQLRTINVGKSLSNEHRQKISNARKGIIFTEDHKSNISKSHLGLLVGENNPFYGKTHSEETKEKFRGENNKQSKLTELKVIDIREKYNSGDFSQRRLANEYNISREQIGKIVRGIGWKYLLTKGKINE